MMARTSADTRSRWGRTRFAGGRIPALAFAIPVGLLLATGVGAITLWSRVAQGEYALLIAGMGAFFTSWGMIGLVWALVVDRTTIRGAVDKPEQSIESEWMEAAMAGAFRDTIMMTGLGLVALGLTGFELDALPALTGVLFIAICSTFVRYLMAKKRG
ncbi:MAG: hypothetical protein L0I94_11930 [Yaniella sp.]|uniref:hypothetical protein n=1 Tax=Yaniella sp. TaxID=2773929 RepID=UPI0026470C43|nr:hypothetical protein [Yaniella sp.]MDN5818850.1 hypothetical protein [Yaniella sp.]MDN6149517.1 hypothetical protein [Yaniella sp.]MDN6151273.1 hypothetical protein [Yaniella sp.]